MQVKEEIVSDDIDENPDRMDLDGFIENEDILDDDDDDEEVEEDDEEGETTNSDSTASLEVEVVKRRRISNCRVRRRDRVPRLLVKDIRKIYSMMFINSINSGDFSLLYGFLDTYYDRNSAHYTLTKYAPGGTEKLFSMNFHGLDEVGKYWYSILRVSPDNVVVLLDSVIQPSTGKIVCKFQKRATQLYVDPPGSAGYYAPYVFVDKKYGNEIVCTNDKKENDFDVGGSSSSLSRRNNGKEMDSKFLAMQEIMESVDSVVRQLPLQTPPKTVVAEGMFIISTDSNKRITKIEVKVGF